MLRFRYLPIKYNHSSRNGAKITYIVIHDTGNPRHGADAMNHYRYFNGGNRSASAHYFVDDKQIVQLVGDSRSAWAVGDGKGRYGVTNSNSLSIELCINSDSNYDTAFYHTVELTKNLMEKFKIPESRVIRHYDSSRKSCPNTMRANNWAKWHEFKKQIQEPKKLIIDTSRDSVAREAGSEIKVEENAESAAEKNETTNQKNIIQNTNSKQYEVNGLEVIETDISNLYVQQLGGRTLRQIDAYGINGVVFDNKNSASPDSTWAIAINNGKPIGKNANVNHHDSAIKRATILYGQGRLTIQRINNIKEAGRNIDLAIGGIGLYPSIDLGLEKITPDLLRVAERTAVAFKGKTVYLIATTKKLSLPQLRSEILKSLDIDGAIAIDGGGSTQMHYPKFKGIHTSRRLNNIIGIKRV